MDFKQYLSQAKHLLVSQPNQMALLSNASAFLYEIIPTLNWVGFYIFDGDKLTVGPFQGKVACSVIELGKGVCGQAAMERKTIIIDDVLSHDNHIACDAQSRSEVVIPIVIKGKLFGVLDVDSPVFSRFDQELVVFLEKFVSVLNKLIDK